MNDQGDKAVIDRARDLRALAEHYWHLAAAPQTPLAIRYRHMEVAQHLETILGEWEREGGMVSAVH